MPRSQGFARGDLDTAFPLDDKFLDLRGRLDAERYYAATGVYWTVVASSWREADRKVALRVAPDAPDLIGELVAVKLLDADGRLPNRAFTSWIGRARRQRKASAERQARNRAGKSREVTPLSPVTNALSSPARASAPQGRDGTAETETGGARGDEWDAPEQEALIWLSKHGCDIRPGNGYHQKLITAVEVHGVNAMVGMFDRLAGAGTAHGDIKGFLFTAIDALNAQTRPDLRALEKEDDSERAEISTRRQVENTQRRAHEIGQHEAEPRPNCPLCSAA